jgi:CPA1 family monovalent cation:H+ antiporter
MSLFSTLAILLSLSAVLSYANERTLRLPTTVALMASSMGLSLGLVGLGVAGIDVGDWAQALLERVDFDEALLEGMLSYLLFAGALHIKLDELKEHRTVIATLATVGVVLSTVLVGTAMYAVLGWLHVDMPLSYALVFGALISPTDPIAVIGILKTARAPKSLATNIAGESLFNDGVGVVVFVVLLGIAEGHAQSPGSVAWLLAQEALGGALFGWALGQGCYLMLRSVDHYHLEVLITLALVTGGYAVAMALHVSGPIAVVVAGLLVGNKGRALGMSDITRDRVDTFWELIDEILNAVLFVLIGLEIILVRIDRTLALASLAAVVIALTARLLVVGMPVTLMRRSRGFVRGTARIMTWGGLRGGISVALALSLPPSAEREKILAITYFVVAFSVIVQGLTVGRLVRRFAPEPPAPTPG